MKPCTDILWDTTECHTLWGKVSCNEFKRNNLRKQKVHVGVKLVMASTNIYRVKFTPRPKLWQTGIIVIMSSVRPRDVYRFNSRYRDNLRRE